MQDCTQVDVRSDQLKILKLENRVLKPLALKIVDKNSSKSVKLTAVSAAILALAALQAAPASYAAKLDLPESISTASVEAISIAQAKCSDLAVLIKNGADFEAVVKPLEDVFSIVQSEHERLEALAKGAHAKLISPSAFGDGSKGEPPVWLKQLLSRG